MGNSFSQCFEEKEQIIIKPTTPSRCMNLINFSVFFSSFLPLASSLNITSYSIRTAIPLSEY